MAGRCATRATPAGWSVLMVCTGNICRSPLAERLAVTRLAHLLPRAGIAGTQSPLESVVTVRSAGVRACVGEPMHPYASTVLDERGVEYDGFVARQLTAAMVEGADLVLCATRRHRAEAVTLVPRAVRRSFTLREFARLIDSAWPEYRPLSPMPVGEDQRERLRVAGMVLLEIGSAARGIAPPIPPDDDDITDPLGGQLDAFRSCAETIDAALEPVERALTVLLGAEAVS